MFQQKPESDPEVVKRATETARHRRVQFWFDQLAKSVPDLPARERARISLTMIRLILEAKRTLKRGETIDAVAMRKLAADLGDVPESAA